MFFMMNFDVLNFQTFNVSTIGLWACFGHIHFKLRILALVLN